MPVARLGYNFAGGRGERSLRIVLSMRQAEAGWAAALRDWSLGLYLVYASVQDLTSLFLPGADTATMTALNDVQGSLLNQIAVMAALIFAIAVSLLNRTPWNRLWNGVVPLLAFVGIAALSIAWSDYPDLASRRVLRLAAELATLILLVSAYSDTGSLFKVVFRALAFVMLLDIAALALHSAYTPLGYQGVHGHKNQAGSFAFFALPVFVLAVRDRRIVHSQAVAILFALAAVAIMILSQSKTAGVATVSCAAFIFALYALHSHFRWLAAGFSLFTAAAAAGFVFFSDLSWPDLLASLTGDPTFTGREYVWDFMLSRIAQSPWIGYGFGSFWGVGQDTGLMLQQSNITFYFGQAHNGYLDVAGELGLLGVIAVTIMFAWYAAKIVRLYRSGKEFGFFLFSTYIMLGFVLYNLTELVLFRPGADLWIYFVITMQAVICFTPLRSDKKLPARPRNLAIRRM